LALARAFVTDAAARTGRTVSGFTPAAAHQLLRYGWPGNVRELENAIERAVVLTRRSRIDVDDLPPEVGLAVPDAIVATDVRPLADVERDYIRSALRAVGGNRSQAAQKLGIGEATLYRKIKQFGDSAPIRGGT
jgi:DNA-binding NtrC family response regulator